MNTINIEQSKNVETIIPVISDYKNFENILKTNSINSIDDINNSQKFKILDTLGNYVFQINGINKFQIQNETFLRQFLTQYSISHLNQAIQFDLNNHRKEIKILGALEKTNTELIRLMNQTIGSLNERMEEATNPATNVKNIKLIREYYNDLLKKIDDNLNTRRNRKALNDIEKTNWNLLKIKAEQTLKIVDSLENTNNDAFGKLKNIAVSGNLLLIDPTTSIMEVYDKLNDMIKETHIIDVEIQELETRNAEIVSLYNIDLKHINQKEAKQILKAINSHNDKQKKSTKKNAEIVGNTMTGKDLNGLLGYLNAKSKNQEATFKPEYQDQLNELNRTMGTANAYFDNADTSTRSGTNINRRNSTTNLENQRTSGVFTQEEINNMNPQERRIYNSMLEANSKGGAFGALDHRTKDYQDQSPRGQQFYKSFGNVALLAGGIFLGAKFIKSAWRIITGKAAKDKNDNSWAWILGTGGLLLATAGRPQDLFKGGYASEMVSRFFNWAGGKGKNNKSTTTGSNTPTITPSTLDIAGGSSQNTSQLGNSSEMVSSMVGAVTLFNGQTYGSMSKMLEQTGENDNKIIKIKKEEYKKMKQGLEAAIKLDSGISDDERKKTELQLKFLKQIGPEDKTGFVNTVLTGIGLSRDEISKNENEKVNFDDKFKENFERILKLTEYMQDKEINNMGDKETQKVQEYINKGKLDLNTIFEERSELIKERKEKIAAKEINIGEMSNEDIFNIEDFDKRLVIKERRKIIKEKGIDIGEMSDENIFNIEDFDKRLITEEAKLDGRGKGEVDTDIEETNPEIIENETHLNQIVLNQVKKHLEKYKSELGVLYIETNNPYLNISFEIKVVTSTYNTTTTIPGDLYPINIHELIEGEGANTIINHQKLKKSVIEQKELFNKDQEQKATANETLDKIKKIEYNIEDLFPNAQNNLYYRDYFQEFWGEKIVVDKEDTIKFLDDAKPGERYTKIKITLDNKRRNKSYNKDYPVKLTEITTNKTFDETKFKNKLKDIIQKIIEKK